MDKLISILVTFLVGGIVGSIFYKIKFPGGVMFGAACGTIFLTFFSDYAYAPSGVKFLAQIMVGAIIGCSVEKNDLKMLRGVYKPALIVIASLLCINLLSGLFLVRSIHLDPLSALLGTIPGSMSNITLIAADMGASMLPVVVLQFMRLCTGIGLFPGFILLVSGGKKRGRKKYHTKAEPRKSPLIKTMGRLLLAGIAGYAGKTLRIPAGSMLFSIAASFTFNVISPISFPHGIKWCAQLLSGVYIGCSVSRASLLSIPKYFTPGACICLLYMLNSFLVGHLLKRRFQIPLGEGMLMATPAGATDIVLISSDMGLDSSRLVLIHIIRMFAAVTVFPQLYYQILA